MGRVLLTRFFFGFLAWMGVVILVFFMIHAIPGDPVDNLLGEQVQPTDKEAFRKRLHLDESLPSQFVRYLSSIVDGSLGYSYTNSNATVVQCIREVLPYTLELALFAMAFALALAIPLGIVAAVHRGSWLDTLAMMLAVMGVSLPAVWVGPLLIYLFVIKWPLLPPPGSPYAGIVGLILPSVTLGLALCAMLARMMRSSMARQLQEDYVRTARAKGLSETRVLFVHALRNALIPVITVVGMQFGALLSGAVIVEKIYARPGIGTLLLRAILQRDYPVVQGTVLIVALLVIIVTQLTDGIYALIDPRLRSSTHKGFWS